ncbi:MAG: hypothetical protein ACTSR0_07245 [Candidatus Asgardarchaeia archaeon]
MDLMLDEVEDVYRERTKKIMEPYLREVREVFDGIREIVDELKSLTSYLMRDDIDAPELALSSAMKFGEKVEEEIEKSFNLPEDAKYSEVNRVIENLEAFLNKVMKYGKIWVPKLTREYKSVILKMDRCFKTLGEYLINLRKIQGNYKKINKIEVFYSKKRVLDRLIKEISKMEENRDKILHNLELIREKIEEKNRELEKLREAHHLKKLEDLMDELSTMERSFMDYMNIVQKLFKKILRSNLSSPIKADLYQTMKDYSEDPFNTFIKEELGYPKLKELLKTIEGMLSEIKMKRRDENRLRRKIRSIRSGALEGILERSKRIRKEIDTISSEKVGRDIESLEDEINSLERKMERHNFILKNLNAKIDMKKEKIKDLVKSIEDIFDNFLDERVKIILDF